MRSDAEGKAFGRWSSALRRAHLLGFGLLGILSVAAPAKAQGTDAHPVDSALKMLDMKTDQGAMPDFVEKSRPKQDSDYIPVGSKHPERPIKPKTPAEIAAATADLDAARTAQLAGKRPKPWRPDTKAAAKPLKTAPKLATDR